MLRRLGRFTVRRRRWVLAGYAGGIGGRGGHRKRGFGRLSGGGFNDPAGMSRAAERRKSVRRGRAELRPFGDGRGGTVDDAAVAARGLALTEELAGEAAIEQAFSYWSLGSPPPLRSTDGSQALVIARIGGNDDEVDAAVEELSPLHRRTV